MSSLQTFRKIVKQLIKDNKFGMAVDDYISLALDEFEEDRNNSKSVQVTVSAATDTFNLATIASDFDTGYGQGGLLSVEYPLNADQTIPQYNDQYFFYYDATNTQNQLRFTFKLDSNFILSYRIPYNVDEDSSDVPTKFEMPVGKLAASYMAQALSTRYSEVDSLTEPADVVDYADKANRYRSNADEWRNSYRISIDNWKGIPHPYTTEKIQHYPRLTR